MSARPRVSIRLSPSYLHALAWIAEREDAPPAELGRSMIQASIDAWLDKHGWRPQWNQAYSDWLADRAAVPNRAESPTEADYDRVASVGLAGPLPPKRPADAVVASVLAGRRTARL